MAQNTKKLSDSEFAELIRLAHKALWADSETHRKIQKHRVNIVPANFYSDIPTVEEIEHSFEFDDLDKGPFSSPKIFDPDVLSRNLDFLQEFSEEFDPPVDGDVKNPDGYFWSNPAFSFSDAMAYYCFIRRTKPNRIVEIGSGFSSLVAKLALKKNGGGNLICIEPFPLEWMAARVDEFDIKREKVQSLPPEYFNDMLEDGDILFIDSTHTVKNGSDCLHLYLRVLPNIKRKILVHAHDIYLPFPFPKNMMLGKRVFWTEQYLLYAYLLDNPKTQVLYGSMVNHKWLKSKLDRLMHGRKSSGGASFWFSLDGATKDTTQS